MKKDKFEKLLKRFPASFAVVAQRAYKRRKYFQAVLRSAASVETDAPGMYSLFSLEDQTGNPEAAQLLAQIEDNFDVMTEEENEELKAMLEQAQEQEDEFQKKAIEDMEEAAAKFKTLKRQIEELTVKMTDMQNTYEADLAKLTDVLNSMSQDAPLHEVLAKINQLQE